MFGLYAAVAVPVVWYVFLFLDATMKQTHYPLAISMAITYLYIIRLIVFFLFFFSLFFLLFSFISFTYTEQQQQQKNGKRRATAKKIINKFHYVNKMWFMASNTTTYTFRFTFFTWFSIEFSFEFYSDSRTKSICAICKMKCVHIKRIYAIKIALLNEMKTATLLQLAHGTWHIRMRIRFE